MMCDICHIVVTYVTVGVTESYDKENIIKGSKTNDIIQYSYSILVLWKVYGL